MVKNGLLRYCPKRPDAPSAHRRPGYSLSGCTPAEPDSASPGRGRIATPGMACKRNQVLGNDAPSECALGGWAKLNWLGERTRRCKLGRMPLKNSSEFGRLR